MHEIKAILKFPSTAGFGSWRKYFPEDAISHPAKMNLNLLQYLVLNYTNEGDVVLDPMAGTGATGVICALNGRNCVQVELEERFFKWMEQARENVEKTSLLTKKGKIVNICGDARKLSELLKEHEEEIRCVLFSPPYAQSACKGGRTIEKRFYERDKTTLTGMATEYSDNPNNIGNLPIGEIENILFSPPYSLGHDSGDNASERYKWRLDEQKKHTRAYSEENNIAKLSHGEIDSVIFSPPYSSISPQSKDKEFLGRIARDYEEGHPWKGQRFTTKNVILRYEDYNPNNPLNIGNLPHGEIGSSSMNVDIILTSPPYSETLNEKKNTSSNLRREERLRTAGHQPEDFMGGNVRNCQVEDGLRYSFNSENIGNLKHGNIDVVLTIPPYEESMGDKHHSPKGDKFVREKRHYNTYTETKKKDNIGNLHKETYLSAMLTVYKQCYLVLKQGGKMIIVIKDFVRNFKVVRLHEHTIKLCELAGFVLKEVLLFKLPQKSFWRILYQKKHGAKVKDLNLLDYEWVLVFEKPV